MYMALLVDGNGLRSRAFAIRCSVPNSPRSSSGTAVVTVLRVGSCPIVWFSRAKELCHRSVRGWHLPRESCHCKFPGMSTLAISPTDPKELRPLLHAEVDRLRDENLLVLHRVELELDEVTERLNTGFDADRASIHANRKP